MHDDNTKKKKKAKPINPENLNCKIGINRYFVEE